MNDKKVIEFSARERIEEQATEWIIRLDNDRALEPDELQRFKAWLNASPAHREELTALTAFWSDQSLAALPIPLERLCPEPLATDSKPRLWQGGYPWLAAVTMAFFALFIGNTFWWSTDNLNGAYATTIGQQRSINLPDGSTLHLNTNSQVKVDYSDAYRTIKLLQGEAYFDVTKDASRPFVVYAGRGKVQAVGTAFTVRFRKNHDVDVLVDEGAVSLAVLTEKSRVASPGNQVKDNLPEYPLGFPVDELGLLQARHETTILVADQSGVASSAQLDGIKPVAQEELERRGAWRSGFLVFSGDSLEEVVKEISRYTTLSINIVDPELKTVRVGGRFSMANTNALFSALEANFGLHITRLDYNRIEISAVEKNNAGK